MSLSVLIAVTWLILGFYTLEQCQANVIFHFSLDFNVKSPTNTTEEINKTFIVRNNVLSVQDNNEISTSTSAPISNWVEESQYNEVAVQHLVQTQRAVQQLNQELTPLVGRSNDLAARLKQTLHYVNDVDASLENGNFVQHMELLRKYVSLVDSLKTPSPIGGMRTLEFVLLKLSIEKYNLLTRQQEIDEYLQRADAAWSRYKDTQVVFSETPKNLSEI